MTCARCNTILNANNVYKLTIIDGGDKNIDFASTKQGRFPINIFSSITKSKDGDNKNKFYCKAENVENHEYCIKIAVKSLIYHGAKKLSVAGFRDGRAIVVHVAANPTSEEYSVDNFLQPFTTVYIV